MLRPVATTDDRRSLVSLATAVGALALFAAGALTPLSLRAVAPLLVVALAVTLRAGRLLAWKNQIALLVLVILFVPIRRYVMPGQLPFQLEPYRLLCALVLGAWASSLLIDRRVRLRGTALDGPLFAFTFAALASVIANSGRVTTLGLQSEVVKRLTFFASFFAVVYLIRSLIRSDDHIDFIVKTLVAGGSVLAFFAVLEARTDYNVFNHLSSVLPGFRLGDLPYSLGTARGSRLRVYASAEHPIALGAALAMLLPLALYLAVRFRQRRWYAAAVLVGVGSLTTISRTTIIMLVVLAVVMSRVRKLRLRRFWPLLVPLLIAVHLALPGTIGSFKETFFPKGGLVAEQKQGAGTYGSGRIADLGPGLHEFSQHPFLGEGFGTRVTEKGPKQNAPILDDQWLGLLLETGILGALAMLWLFSRSIRRLLREAKQDASPRGLLLGGLAASVAAYAVSMVTYDALAFVQVTFLLFILLGLGAALLPHKPRAAH